MPSIVDSIIEPSTFKGVESDFSIIFPRSREVYLVMSTVEVTTPKDKVSHRTELIHPLRELCIEYELVLPSLL
jgi:hypothetical protein